VLQVAARDEASTIHHLRPHPFKDSFTSEDFCISRSFLTKSPIDHSLFQGGPHTN
jgi:hypothetical protein